MNEPHAYRGSSPENEAPLQGSGELSGVVPTRGTMRSVRVCSVQPPKRTAKKRYSELPVTDFLSSRHSLRERIAMFDVNQLRRSRPICYDAKDAKGLDVFASSPPVHFKGFVLHCEVQEALFVFGTCLAGVFLCGTLRTLLHVSS